MAPINLGQLAERAHLNKEYFILGKDGIPVIGTMDAEELEDYLELQDPKVRRFIRTDSRGGAYPGSLSALSQLRGLHRHHFLIRLWCKGRPSQPRLRYSARSANASRDKRRKNKTPAALSPSDPQREQGSDADRFSPERRRSRARLLRKI